MAASTDIRVNVNIGALTAPFWDTTNGVDSDGYTIAFGDGLGNSLTWSRTSWDYAAKTATLRVDYTTPAGSTTTDNCVIYMYVGAPPTVALTNGSAVAYLAPVSAPLQRWGGSETVNGSAEVETPQWFRAQVYDSAASLLTAWTSMNQSLAAFVPGVGFGVLAYLSPNTEADARLVVTVGTSSGYTYITHYRVTAATPVIV
ncbi:MAG: hypothetical protein ACO3PB_04615 [Miltoncostaeaceae bacterium]